jgi:membrane protease YdiL (CAAX protease family)
MSTKQKKGHAFRFLILFFAVCLTARMMDSLLLRTDEGVIGELFTHKLFGIALMGWALYSLHINRRDIGFAGSRFGKGVLIGLMIGVPIYAVAYGAELVAAKNASLQFFATSYNVTGNTVLDRGILFVLICVAGNIVNVVMEDGVFRGLFLKVAESRYSFFKAALFSSVLFGIWHGIMPLRNFLTGEQSPAGALMSGLMLMLTGFVFGVVLCLLCRLEGSLWAGMTVHFINNASVNLLHVVTASGVDELQTMRISIAQTLVFIVVLILFLRHRKKPANAAATKEDSSWRE